MRWTVPGGGAPDFLTPGDRVRLSCQVRVRAAHDSGQVPAFVDAAVVLPYAWWAAVPSRHGSTYWGPSPSGGSECLYRERAPLNPKARGYISSSSRISGSSDLSTLRVCS